MKACTFAIGVRLGQKIRWCVYGGGSRFWNRQSSIGMLGDIITLPLRSVIRKHKQYRTLEINERRSPDLNRSCSAYGDAWRWVGMTLVVLLDLQEVLSCLLPSQWPPPPSSLRRNRDHLGRQRSLDRVPAGTPNIWVLEVPHTVSLFRPRSKGVIE